MKARRAVVLLSGGLDSTTCLAVARSEGFDTHALSVDYGQRHKGELQRARRIARALGAAGHRVVRVDLAAFERRRSGARIRNGCPSTPARVATAATRSNARRTTGRQSGYPE